MILSVGQIFIIESRIWLLVFNKTILQTTWNIITNFWNKYNIWFGGFFNITDSLISHNSQEKIADFIVTAASAAAATAVACQHKTEDWSLGINKK